MRVLVTGGAGFIGSHLARRLVADSHTVRILDNFSSGSMDNLAPIAPDLEVIVGDLRDPSVVRRAVAGCELVFHEGAIASVPQSFTDPQVTLDVGVDGTLHVLEAARDLGSRRVVFASSSAVYGDNPASPKREDMTPEPLSPYALSKLAGEQLCAIFTRAFGLETVSLRYFNVYGPGLRADSDYAAVIPRFLGQIESGEPVTIFGDGEQTRDFVYIDDIVEANLRAAYVDRAAGDVFNIGTQRATSLNALVSYMGEVLDRPVKSVFCPERLGDIRHSVADIRLAAEVLGYVPCTRIGAGLAKLLDAPALAETPGSLVADSAGTRH